MIKYKKEIYDCTGGINMGSVYYPYFQIESLTRDKYNHKVNITILALFCNDVLIPLRHILNLSEAEFDILIKFKELMLNNVLYFRLPDNISSIDEYDKIYKITKNKYKNRVAMISSIFNKDYKFQHYDPIAQQQYFSDTIKGFVIDYCALHNKTSKQSRDNLTKLCNIDLLTKEDFDIEIKKLRNNKDISDSIFTSMKKAANAIYFLAGISGSRLKLCKDKIFEANLIDDCKCIAKTIPDYEDIVNDSYNPARIIDELQCVGIIKNENEIKKLKCNSIIELRSTKYFRKFVEKYCKLAGTKRALKYLSQKKKTVEKLKGAKSFIVSLLLTIFVSVLSFVLIHDILSNVIISIISFIILFIVSNIIQKFDIKLGFFDKIVEWIIGLFIPDTMYLYKIYETVKRS